MTDEKTKGLAILAAKTALGEAWTLPPQRSLPEIVAERLVEAIRSGTLMPGERLVETALADKLKVSRGPLREALKALEANHLVESRRGRGTYVRAVTPEEVAQMIAVRALLEGLAARTRRCSWHAGHARSAEAFASAHRDRRTFRRNSRMAGSRLVVSRACLHLFRQRLSSRLLAVHLEPGPYLSASASGVPDESRGSARQSRCLPRRDHRQGSGSRGGCVPHYPIEDWFWQFGHASAGEPRGICKPKYCGRNAQAALDWAA